MKMKMKLSWFYYRNNIMMHGPMNIKFVVSHYADPQTAQHLLHSNIYGLLCVCVCVCVCARVCVEGGGAPCHPQELLPIPLCYILFPATLLHQLFSHPFLPHLPIYFFVHLTILLFPDSYILLFWEFYFLPFSVHV